MKRIIIILIIALLSSLFTLHAVAQSCLPEGITFNTQAQIDSFQINYPGCTEIEGNVQIGESQDITSLMNLDILTSIGGNLWIGYNAALTRLEGLEGITDVAGGLSISGNAVLASLEGLEGVTSIGGGLFIDDNAVLTDLIGLEGLISIGGSLQIGNWPNSGNPALESLVGIDNIDANSIESLSIYGNSSLANCEVECVCAYLASQNGDISIGRNATGCDSPEEVEEACETVGEEESSVVSRQSAVKVYPNPTHGIADFRFQISDFGRVTLKIYDLHGREVATVVDRELPAWEHVVSFDAGGLPAGVYIYRKSAVNSQQSAVGKLIKY